MISPHSTSLLLALILVGPAFGQGLIGFRTDGTGRYPDAQPPLSWGPDKNVVWKIKLTQSVGIPVIVGDKIFTCAQPCVLLCINKADGKVLWQHESFFKEIEPTEQEKPVIEAERKQDADLAMRQTALEKELSALRKTLKDDGTPKEEADKKIRAFQVQIDGVRKKRKELTTFYRYQEPGKNGGAWHPTGGYTAATPVTDGKIIYMTYGNGLVAAYDLEGMRLWLKFIEHSGNVFGHAASPVLVNDKLIVHFTDLVALNVKDGSEAWRTKVNANYGSPMPARIGDVDVIIHPSGVAVRVADGSIVARNLGSTDRNSPLVRDGKVFFMSGQARGAILPATLRAGDKWEPLWKGKGASLKGGGSWFPSPILHDDLLYALNGSAAFTVVDLITGQRVYEEKLEFDKRGDCYPSLTLAGKFLFASCDNGETLVLEPGREFKQVGHNTLETFRSSLVFEGKRMYVRTVKNLWCVGE